MNLGIRGLRLALLTIDRLHRFNASIIALLSEFPSEVNVRAGSDKQTLSVSQPNRFVSRFWAKSADESDSNFYHKKTFMTRCDAAHRRPKFSCSQYATGSSSSPIAFCAAFSYLRILAWHWTLPFDFPLAQQVASSFCKQIARPLELSTTDKIAEANTLTNYQWEAIFYGDNFLLLAFAPNWPKRVTHRSLRDRVGRLFTLGALHANSSSRIFFKLEPIIQVQYSFIVRKIIH